jgi:transposase
MRRPQTSEEKRSHAGGVAGVVGIEGGVVSGVLNLESSGVGASDWRPRHEELYQEV